jgi:hypothetical protein
MPKCSVCGKEIGPDEGYFSEPAGATVVGAQAETIYCEKCYANKRVKELPPDAAARWRAEAHRIAALEISTAPPDQKERIKARWKARLPTDWEGDVEAGEEAAPT